MASWVPWTKQKVTLPRDHPTHPGHHQDTRAEWWLQHMLDNGVDKMCSSAVCCPAVISPIRCCSPKRTLRLEVPHDLENERIVVEEILRQLKGHGLENACNKAAYMACCRNLEVHAVLELQTWGPKHLRILFSAGFS